jgi:hypothetical protein
MRELVVRRVAGRADGHFRGHRASGAECWRPRHFGIANTLCRI